MEGLGRIAELAPEMRDVLDVRLLRERKAAMLQTAHAELHAVLCEDFDAKRRDVCLQLGQSHDSRRTLRLECSFASEHNYRVNVLGRHEIQ